MILPQKKHWLLISLITCLLAATSYAQQQATIRGSLNVSALRPGERAIAAIVMDVGNGLHAQSHTPLDKDLIAFEIAMKPIAGVEFGTPIYPLGKIEQYAALGKISVYTGRIIAFIPVTVKPDVTAQPIKLLADVSYQICNDRTCFPPDAQSVAIETRVAAASDTVTPANAELFTTYAAANVSTAAPASQPESSAPPMVIEGDRPQWGIPLALGAAFLAGILFNIVPCVLPVLPIKVLGFAEVAQHDRAKTIGLASIFGLGIVTVFAALAILILGLKQLSWGQQFSNPWFAWGMVIVLLLLALWLFGMLNVNLPTTVYNFTPRHDTATGNYLWGILTAVLSTPCTGPLFPPLLLWAQGQPTVVGVPALMMVGVGMAFPYVLLSAFPEAARKFPRVGPWAELFKQMLGFVLLGFTVFFAAGRFTSAELQWWAIVPVAGLAALFLMARTVQLTKEIRPVAIAATIAIAILTSSTVVACRFNGVFDPRPAGGNAASVNWTPYSDDALAAARSAGRIVLIKFTANWCLNCQYIEGTVYHDPRAIDELRKHDVVTLKADLTQKSAPGWPRLLEITPTGGIPLTALYVPGYEKPVTLSSVYTTDTLVKTLDQIAKK